MGTAGTIDPTIQQQLVAAGLSVDDVTWLIRRAIDEDLDGGVDVTTVATVPLDQRATLDLTARRAGIAAGIPVAAAVFDAVAAANVNVDTIIQNVGAADAADWPFMLHCVTINADPGRRIEIPLGKSYIRHKTTFRIMH